MVAPFHIAMWPTCVSGVREGLCGRTQGFKIPSRLQNRRGVYNECLPNGGERHNLGIFKVLRSIARLLGMGGEGLNPFVQWHPTHKGW